MKLSTLTQPRPSFTQKQLYEMCSQVFAPNNFVIHANGVIDINDSYYFDPIKFKSVFIKNSRFQVQFGEMHDELSLRVDNLVTLEGSPTSVGVFSIESDYLHDLNGGPTTVRNMYVTADNLKSLRGSLKIVKGGFHITSANLASLEDLDINAGVFACKNTAIKTTTGIDKVRAFSFALPKGLVEITDYPLAAEHIDTPVCKGLARLMLTKGLKSISVYSVHKANELNNLLTDVIEENDSHRWRFLTAQQRLIDEGYEHLV